MGFLSSTEPESPRRQTPLAVAVLLLLLLGGGVTYWMLRRPVPAPTPRPSAQSTPRPTRSVPPTPTPDPGKTPRPHVAATERPAPLHVESDIPGAQVFVDRKYVGTTPFDLREVDPGPHQLNVSVEGHEAHSERIEIADAPVHISVRFREVKLDEFLAVIHKHGMGSCRGRLVATTEGLSYEPASGSHAFRTGFDALEKLEVDYLKKNLKLAVRGGRTYNFTIEAPNADPLLVFQRKVEGAKKRLASGS